MTDHEAAPPPQPHEIETCLHNENGYSLGYFGHCITCQWSGPLRDLNRRGQALRDAYAHQTDVKESAA